MGNIYVMENYNVSKTETTSEERVRILQWKEKNDSVHIYSYKYILRN